MTGCRTGRWRATVSAVGVFLASMAVEVERPAVALVNESPSLPRGLYYRTGMPITPGAVVAVPQPLAVRPYLERLGMPGDVLLLKRVAAVGGDRVCAVDGMVVTPGRRVKMADRDRLGAVLPAWRECRVLERDEVFLLGDTPGSFDSRYFGPVRRSDLNGVFREVLKW